MEVAGADRVLSVTPEYNGTMPAVLNNAIDWLSPGHVGHCELGVGDARWMMSDEFESAGVAPPDLARGACVTLHLRVPDCDAAAARVNAAGIEMTRGPEDSPPAGGVAVSTDPFGHRWFLNQALPEQS